MYTMLLLTPILLSRALSLHLPVARQAYNATFYLYTRLNHPAILDTQENTLLILSPVEKSLHLSKISWKILLSQRNQHVGHYRASNLITYECVSHIYDSTCPPLWNEQLSKPHYI